MNPTPSSRTFALALALALSAVAPARPLGPEWKHIKAAEKKMRAELFLEAEKDLKKAMEVNPAEPKALEDQALIHIAFDELAKARRSLNKAVEISKKKAAKFEKGTDPRKSWDRYLAELFSALTEVTILENEKVLKPKLLGKGKAAPAKDVQAAMGKVKNAFKQVQVYGTFRSQVDDPLIEKALAALTRGTAQPAEIEEAAGGKAEGDEEGAEEPKPARKGKVKKAEEPPPEEAAEEAPEEGAEEGGEPGAEEGGEEAAE